MLHERLVAEFGPEEPLEEDIVAYLALLIWRKQNINPSQAGVHQQEGTPVDLYDEEGKVNEESRFRIAELSFLNSDFLLRELEIVDRLDSMIARCIKRLLMVRGVKSMAHAERAVVCAVGAQTSVRL